MLRLSCDSTALRSFCCFSMLTAIMRTLGEVGLRARLLGLPATLRFIASQHSKPFHFLCVGCWCSKIPMKIDCTWRKEYRESGVHQARRLAWNRLQLVGAESRSALQQSLNQRPL